MYIDQLRGHFTQLQSDLAHRPILPTVTSEEVLLGDDRFVWITFAGFPESPHHDLAQTTLATTKGDPDARFV